MAPTYTVKIGGEEYTRRRVTLGLLREIDELERRIAGYQVDQEILEAEQEDARQKIEKLVAEGGADPEGLKPHRERLQELADRERAIVRGWVAARVDLLASRLDGDADVIRETIDVQTELEKAEEVVTAADPQRNDQGGATS